MENYFELKLKINPKMSEIISGICFDKLDCEGVVTADEELDDDGNLFNKNEDSIKIYLKSIKNVGEILKEERKILLESGFTDEALGSWQFEISKVENEDWSRKWKENWEITPVGEKIKVVPSWKEYLPQKDEVIIKLDPETAFGTGCHATTQLCMLAEEKYMKKDAIVADIGTGTGILAICAAKLGAKSVYGCDNDETVIETAIQNAKMNGVSDKCHFEYGTVDKITLDVILNLFDCFCRNFNFVQNVPNGQDRNIVRLSDGKMNNEIYQFDFVVANVLHFIIAEIMGDLKALMKDDAYLSLSGILDEKRDIVLEAIQKHGLKVVEENHIDIWVGFVVKKDI